MPIILVVDDSPVDQKLVAGLLERDIDWLVSFADNVEQAIEMVDDIFPDIVVTDLQMPGMSGIQLMEHLKGQRAAPRVIVLTAYAETTYLRQLLETGVAGYVLKRSTIGVLVDASIVMVEESASMTERPVARWS